VSEPDSLASLVGSGATVGEARQPLPGNAIPAVGVRLEIDPDRLASLARRAGKCVDGDLVEVVDLVLGDRLAAPSAAERCPRKPPEAAPYPTWI
jgi:hypothetical protein